MKVTIGGIDFPSKKDIKEYVQKILYGTEFGQPVNKSSFDFMLDLLSHHPNSAKKIGVGVAEIFIQSVPTFSKLRCFCVRRIDGTVEDFSFLQCFNGTNRKKELAQAMRRAIMQQTIEVRDYFFSKANFIQCPITGAIISKETCHVDHAHPLTFDYLMNTFLEAHNLDVEQIELLDPPGGIGRMIADENIVKAWQDYHYHNAKLRCVSKQANLGVLRRKDYLCS